MHLIRAKQRSGILPILISVLAAIVFMAVSFSLYWPTPEIAFRTDDSPVAWLSSAQMWAIAILSLRLWQERALPPLLSAWLAIALMLMACDEQFMLHEQWKYQCLEWISLCQYYWVTEIPMLLVIALGVATGFFLLPYFLTPLPKSFLLASLAVGLFAMVLRFTGMPSVLLPYKALFLVLAQGLFLGTLLGLPIGKNEKSI